MKKLTILLLVISLSACELYKQDDYREYYVVESYLVANDTLPRVRLSTTAPINQKYSFTETAVSGAEIEIRLLNADSTIADTYSYTQQEAGIYQPLQIATVRDRRLYELHIKTREGKVITATTYVPEDFDTVNELQDRYVYQSNNQITVTTTPSSYITGRQTFYIFTVNAEDTELNNLTPFYRDLVLNQDNTIENYHINSSGIINEGNYEKNADGNITLRVPWLSIAFYGDNKVIANAIDDNMYDFLRSQDVQGGGSTLSPGEIQNIQYNISGGIGIFGSMASDTNFVEIIRPESTN